MKTKLNSILVVEGKTDIAFLDTFLDCEFVITNGFDVPCETIDYLKESSKSKNIIVLTDPDFPGLKIREILNKAIPNLKHAFVRKEVSIKKDKVGVAESTKEEVLNALTNLYEEKDIKLGTLTEIDLYNLGLVGGNKSGYLRKSIAEAFHLGFVNGKTLLKRLNSCNISYEEIERKINELR